MNRRQMLNQMMKSGVATSSVIGATIGTSIGTSMMSRGERFADDAKESISHKFDQLEARFDKLEHHHKNLIRVGALAFGISMGVDLTLFF